MYIFKKKKISLLIFLHVCNTYLYLYISLYPFHVCFIDYTGKGGQKFRFKRKMNNTLLNNLKCRPSFAFITWAHFDKQQDKSTFLKY